MGRAYVQALNPPFIPFSSSGNDPNGAFILLGVGTTTLVYQMTKKRGN